MVLSRGEGSQRNNSIRVNGGFLEKEEPEEDLPSSVRRATKLIFDLSFDRLPSFEAEDDDGEDFAQDQQHRNDDVVKMQQSSSCSSTTSTITTSSSSLSWSSPSPSPWKVSSKETGKGYDIRQGEPITFFPSSKDDSRLIIHEEARNLKLRHSEAQARGDGSGSNSGWSVKADLKKTPTPANKSIRNKNPIIFPKNTCRSSSPIQQQQQQQQTRNSTAPVFNNNKTTTTTEAKAPIKKPQNAESAVADKKDDEETPLRRHQSSPVDEEAKFEDKRTISTSAIEAKESGVVTPPIPPASIESTLMLQQLEKQLHSLQHTLQQNQQQVEVLTNENAKLSEQWKKKAASHEAVKELQNAVEVLQAETTSTWKAMQKEKQEEAILNEGSRTENCKLLVQLEKQLQSLQHSLQENQQQVKMLTTKNTLLSLDLKEKTTSHKAFMELQGAVQTLQQEAAATNWKAMQQVKKDEVAKESCRSADSKMISQLEKQLQALQHSLEENQHQVEALTNENTKLSQELKEGTASFETYKEIQNSVEFLKQEAATLKALQQKKGGITDQGCGSCQVLQKSLEDLKQETDKWKTQMQEEKESLEQRLKEEVACVESSIRNELVLAVKDARDSNARLMEQNRHFMNQTLSRLQNELVDAKKESRQAKEATDTAMKLLQAKVEQQHSELNTLRQDLQQEREEGKKARRSIEALRTEAITAQRRYEEGLQQTIRTLREERQQALSQKGAQLQAAADDQKALTEEAKAQLLEVKQRVQTLQNDKAELRAEFLERIEQQQQSMKVVKKEGQEKLKEQMLECQSLRKELEECKLDGMRDKECITNLQNEISNSKCKFRKVEASLEAVEKAHQEAIKKLEECDAESRQFMQQSWEDNSGALTIAHDRIADLEKSFRKAEEARQSAECANAKKIQQQEKRIAEMKEDHLELQEVLAWTKTEKETVKGMMAEREQALEATKFRLQDTQDSLEAVTAEKDMVLDQLTANAEKCMTAATATEEMKALLRRDAKQIESLHLTVASLECERDKLNKRLNIASSELESNPDPEVSALERKDSFDSYELDLEDLLGGMNMPETFDDSMMFLGDRQGRSVHRSSSIYALEELEAELGALLDQSAEVLPPSRQSTMFRERSVRHFQNRRSSIMKAERHMSFFVAQKQRDSAEEEVLAQIRELN